MEQKRKGNSGVMMKEKEKIGKGTNGGDKD